MGYKNSTLSRDCFYTGLVQSSTLSIRLRGPIWEEEEEEEFKKNLKIPKLIFTIDTSNLLNFIVATV